MNHGPTAVLVAALFLGDPGLAQPPVSPTSADRLVASTYEVWRGARRVMFFNARPGILGSIWPAGVTPERHPFLEGGGFAPGEEVRLRAIVAQSKDALDFIERLRAAGYDVRNPGQEDVEARARRRIEDFSYDHELTRAAVDARWGRKALSGVCQCVYGLADGSAVQLSFDGGDGRLTTALHLAHRAGRLDAILYDRDDRIRHRTLSQLSSLVGRTFTQIVAIWGRPDDDVGSGRYIAVYYLGDRSKVVMAFGEPRQLIQNVTHEFPNGMVETLYSTAFRPWD